MTYLAIMDKKRLRKKYLLQRMDLSDVEVQKRSQQLVELVTNLLQPGHQHIHVFVSHVLKKEVNTYPLVEALWQQGRKVIAPKVLGAASMTHHLWTVKTEFRINSWGIAEPSGMAIDIKLLDVVIVPLLAIDQQGHRVGYGKGFYDRFLAQCRTDIFTIGVGFFPPLNVITDIDANDVALDAYVTQDQTWFFRSEAKKFSC